MNLLKCKIWIETKRDSSCKISIDIVVGIEISFKEIKDIEPCSYMIRSIHTTYVMNNESIFKFNQHHFQNIKWMDIFIVQDLLNF